MEDFYYAGGLRALLASIGDLASISSEDRERQDARRELEGAKIYTPR